MSSLKERVSEPVYYARLINKQVLNYSTFGYPKLEICQVIEVALKGFIAIVIMANCSMEESVKISGWTALHNLVDSIINALYQNQLLIQAISLGYQVLYGILFFSCLIRIEKKSSLVNQVLEYALSMATLLQITILKLVLSILSVSGLIFKKQGSSAVYYSIYALASLNILCQVAQQITLPRLFLNELLHYHSLHMPQHLWLLFEAAKTLVFAMGFIACSRTSIMTFTLPDWVSTLLLLAFAGLNFSMRAQKRVAMTLIEAIRFIESVVMISIMMVATIRSGYILPKSDSFTTLLIYSLLLTISNISGMIFLFLLNKNYIWQQIFTQKSLTSDKVEAIIALAIEKLLDMKKNGNKSDYLIDFVQLLRYHKKYICKNIDCICRKYSIYLSMEHDMKLSDDEEEQMMDSVKEEIYQSKGDSSVMYIFFVEFILEFAKINKTNFPNSFVIVNQCLKLVYFKKSRFADYAAQALLIGVNGGSVGISALQKIHLAQLEDVVYKRASSNNKHFINPQELLQLHELEHSLKETLLTLSINISIFWNIVAAENLDLEKAVSSRQQLSQSILDSQNVFAELELLGSNPMTLNLMQSMVHRLIYNDQVTADLYLKKIQSLRDMKRLYQGQNIENAYELMYTVINSTPEGFGKIIKANRKAVKLLGYSEEELIKNTRLDDLLPKQLRIIHGRLVQKINLSGHEVKVFREEGVNSFVVKKNGYLNYFNFKIQIIYTKDERFSYLAIAKKLLTIQVDSLATPLKFKDTLIFHCSEDKMEIFEISESCYKCLNLRSSYLSQRELTLSDERLSMFDIFPGETDVLESFLIDKTNTASITKISLDLNIISALLLPSLQHQPNFTGATLILTRKILKMTLTETKSFIEAFVQLHKIETIKLKTRSKLQGGPDIDEEIKEEMEFKNVPHEKTPQQLEEEYQYFKESVSNDSSASSNNISFEGLRQFFNSNQLSQTSKTLKIMYQLILIVFGIMMVVSSLNLTLTIRQQSSQRGQTLVVQSAYNRMYYQNKLRVLVRSILYISNGYEPTSSELAPDRISAYQEMLLTYISELEDIQDNLDNILDKQIYNFQRNTNSVQVYYINGNGQKYAQNQSFSPAFKLYLKQNYLLATMTREQMKGQLQIQTLTNINESRPSIDEQIAYFVVTNQIKDLRVRCISEADYFASKSLIDSESGITQSVITLVISVSAIIIVGLTIIPMLSKFQQKKYQCLSFFLKVENSLMQTQITKCQEFCEFIDASEVELLKKESRQQNFIKKKRNQRSIQDAYLGSDDYEEQVQENKSDTMAINKINALYPTFSVLFPSELNLSEENFQLDQTVSRQSKVLKQNESIQKTIKNEQVQIEEKQNSQLPEQVNVRKLEFEKDINSATKAVVKHTLFKVLALICFFSMYFVSTFIIQKNMSDQIPRMINDLKSFYLKGVNIESMIVFTRGNLFVKTPYMLNNDETQNGQEEQASAYYINQSLASEQTYRDLKKNIPPYFKAISSFIDSIDVDICSNQGLLNLSISNCSTISGGILGYGYSNVISMVIQYYQQIDLIYNTNKNKTLEFLTAQIMDEKSLSLMQVNEVVLSIIGDNLKERATLSAINYFELTRYYYGMMFGVFVLIFIVLLVIFIAVIFKKMEKESRLINVGFKIIPLQNKGKEELGKLKAFCLN